MKSHRCKKPRGDGSTALDTIPNLERDSSIEPAQSALCHHIDARGHRCRMLRSPDGMLCPHHARRLLRETPDGEAQASDLLSDIEDFSTAASVNLFLGNLTRQLVRKRIQRRDALALAYLSQLLLNSLSAMNREDQASAQEPAQPREIIWDGPRPRMELAYRAGQAAATIDAAQPAT